MCGVTGAVAGGEVVGAEVVGTGGDVVVGIDSGRAWGRTSPSVGPGDSVAPSVGGGAVVVSSVGGVEEVVEALLGSSSGEVGRASVTRGGPEGEKVGEVVFKAREFVFPLIFSCTIQKQLPSEMKHICAHKENVTFH